MISLNLENQNPVALSFEATTKNLTWDSDPDTWDSSAPDTWDQQETHLTKEVQNPLTLTYENKP